MADEPDPERLAALEDRLARAKGDETAPSPMGEAHSQGQLAWRMVTELVAGLLIGFGVGYGLDHLFGTLPWFMLVFTLLGFIAGIRTMMRSAREVEEKTAGTSPQENGD